MWKLFYCFSLKIIFKKHIIFSLFLLSQWGKDRSLPSRPSLFNEVEAEGSVTLYDESLNSEIYGGNLKERNAEKHKMSLNFFKWFLLKGSVQRENRYKVHSVCGLTDNWVLLARSSFYVAFFKVPLSCFAIYIKGPEAAWGVLMHSWSASGGIIKAESELSRHMYKYTR